MTRIMKRFKFPPGCSCKTFVVRELLNKDRPEIARFVDLHNPDIASKPVELFESRRYEALRFAIVAVDGKRVNLEGVPFREMDDWTEKTTMFAYQAYDELNGVPQEELEDFKKGAEIVTESDLKGYSPQTSAP